jgi:phosphatidylglycerol:prolipoprotein diacylglycerol transferase
MQDLHAALSVHTIFDGLALLTASVMLRLVRLPSGGVPQPWKLHPLYLSLASFGMMAGALLAGTGNLLLTGVPEIGKSVVGGLAGAILAIELLKARLGITGSTGLRFVAPLAAAIAVGRIGCYLAGLDDMTYGTPTSLPWGHDFGDGIPRHPVQLYEALAMAAFLAVFFLLLARGNPLATRAGFPLFVGVYAGQRFLWEFLKPYGTVIGPFNLFHLICLGLLAYAWIYGRGELRDAAKSPPLRVPGSDHLAVRDLPRAGARQDPRGG